MESDYIINYCNYNSNIIIIIINYFEVLLNNQNFIKFITIPDNWDIIKNNLDNSNK
jgi:hypothetical protein